jgi:hypothetical protein
MSLVGCKFLLVANVNSTLSFTLLRHAPTQAEYVFRFKPDGAALVLQHSYCVFARGCHMIGSMLRVTVSIRVV